MKMAALVLLFMVAQMFAYKDLTKKYSDLQAEAIKNTPKLSGKYQYAYFVKDFEIIIVLVTIQNPGPIPTSAYDYKLISGDVSIPPSRIVNGSMIIFEYDRKNDKGLILLGEEFIQNRTGPEPLKSGYIVNGWLIFYAKGLVKSLSEMTVQ